MKNTVILVLAATFIFGVLASAKSVPDSGASGDRRRVLEAGLRQMGAVSVPPIYSGDYIGLYEVECFYNFGVARLCRASTVEKGSQTISNSSMGAYMVGSILKANIDGAADASVIKAGKVGCNLVGDHCYIQNIDIQ